MEDQTRGNKDLALDPHVGRVTDDRLEFEQTFKPYDYRREKLLNEYFEFLYVLLKIVKGLLGT
jgi:hypothetical protein